MFCHVLPVSLFFFFPLLSFYLFLAPDLKKIREDGGGEEMGQNSVSQLFLFLQVKAHKRNMNVSPSCKHLYYHYQPTDQKII